MTFSMASDERQSAQVGRMEADQAVLKDDAGGDLLSGSAAGL
jgi:hypothetical protein